MLFRRFFGAFSVLFWCFFGAFPSRTAHAEVDGAGHVVGHAVGTQQLLIGSNCLEFGLAFMVRFVGMLVCWFLAVFEATS